MTVTGNAKKEPVRSKEKISTSKAAARTTIARIARGGGDRNFFKVGCFFHTLLIGTVASAVASPSVTFKEIAPPLPARTIASACP